MSGEAAKNPLSEIFDVDITAAPRLRLANKIVQLIAKDPECAWAANAGTAFTDCATLEAIIGTQDGSYTHIASESLCHPKEVNGESYNIGEYADFFYANNLHKEFDSLTCALGLQEASKTGRFPVTLNISVASALDPDFFEEIDEYREKLGLNPENIVFEILEHDVDPNANIDHLWELKKQGYSFALDDFGLGESHDNRLKVFAVSNDDDETLIDFIKIDGPYIRSYMDNEDFISPYETQGKNAPNADDLITILEKIEGHCEKNNLPLIPFVAERTQTDMEITVLRNIGFYGCQGCFLSEETVQAACQQTCVV